MPADAAAPPFHPLEVALAAGRRLVRDALWWEGRCTWMGWTNEVAGGQMRAAFRALGGNLYDGVAGIAVFLARLHRATGDAAAGEHARGALEQLAALDGAAYAGDGFYVGRAGAAWALVEAGTLLELPAARARGVRMLLRPPAATDNPDVLSGVAGRLLADGVRLFVQGGAVLWADDSTRPAASSAA